MASRYHPSGFGTIPAAEADRSVVTAEIAAFCTSGVSIVVGTVGADGRAIAGRALACDAAEGQPVRLLFDAGGNGALLAAIAAHAPVAATFSEPLTHRSLQLKAPRCAASDVTPADLERLVAQTIGFAAVLATIGYSRAFCAAYCQFDPADIRCCVFTPDQAFVQTPGPTAGEPL